MKSVEENIEIIAEQIAEMNRMNIKSRTDWEERFAEMRARVAEWDARIAERDARAAESDEEWRRQRRHLDAKFAHLAELTGIAFKTLDDLGDDMEEAGRRVKRRSRS
ncbi:MAG: hypothetical protein KIS76_03945 [Pyrinomonadaceae bacterium]|nr:hypothetical protein [Pyrinomonadaceae bacterium]